MRAKIDMHCPNKCMRDPVMYRCIIQPPHHRHGSAFKAYPTYDFACPVVDALEGVTHALRTNEYADRIPQYRWVRRALSRIRCVATSTAPFLGRASYARGRSLLHARESAPRRCKRPLDFAAFRFTSFPEWPLCEPSCPSASLSTLWSTDSSTAGTTPECRQFEVGQLKKGFGNTRFPPLTGRLFDETTNAGILRRGLTMEALLEFILQQGPSKAGNLMEWDKLWTLNKQIIDPKVPRYMAVSKSEFLVGSRSCAD